MVASQMKKAYKVIMYVHEWAYLSITRRVGSNIHYKLTLAMVNLHQRTIASVNCKCVFEPTIVILERPLYLIYANKVFWRVLEVIGISKPYYDFLNVSMQQNL